MIKVLRILNAIDVLAQAINHVLSGPIYHFSRLVTRIHAVIEINCLTQYVLTICIDFDFTYLLQYQVKVNSLLKPYPN